MKKFLMFVLVFFFGISAYSGTPLEDVSAQSVQLLKRDFELKKKTREQELAKLEHYQKIGCLDETNLNNFLQNGKGMAMQEDMLINYKGTPEKFQKALTTGFSYAELEQIRDFLKQKIAKTPATVDLALMQRFKQAIRESLVDPKVLKFMDYDRATKNKAYDPNEDTTFFAVTPMRMDKKLRSDVNKCLEDKEPDSKI